MSPAGIWGASGGITRCSRRRSFTRRGCGCRTIAACEWQGRTHGLALGAQAMRRLLVDHGRHQKRDKRGGGVQPVSLDDLLKAAATGAVPVEDLLTLEAALTRLEAVDPRAAQVVDPAVLFRHVQPGGRRAPGPVGAHGRSRLDARASLAQARAVRSSAGGFRGVTGGSCFSRGLASQGRAGPTRCCTSWLFSLQMYSINSSPGLRPAVNVKVNGLA